MDLCGYQENDNVEHIHHRSAAYGIPGMFIEDGNNVIDVYEGFKKAVDHVRWQWSSLD